MPAAAAPAANVITDPPAWSTPASALRPALVNLQLTLWARMFFGKMPAAQQITESLVWYLSPEFPHPAGMPLIDVCLRHAFEWGNAALNDHLNTKSIDRVLASYLAGLLYPTSYITEYRVVAPSGQAWLPLQARTAPLCEWRQRHPKAVFEPVEPLMPWDPGYMTFDQIRALLLSRFLPIDKLNALVQAGYMDVITGKQLES